MQHILVIDDEPSIRAVLTDILTDAGYRVETAADGREALERIARTPPDLILTDVMMPYLDGWDLLAQVRERLPDLPVVVMSAVDPREAGRRRAVTMDHTVFLSKPFDLETVLVTVARLTDGSASTAELAEGMRASSGSRIGATFGTGATGQAGQDQRGGRPGEYPQTACGQNQDGAGAARDQAGERVTGQGSRASRAERQGWRGAGKVGGTGKRQEQGASRGKSMRDRAERR